MGSMETRCRACGAFGFRPLGCQDRHCPSCGVAKTETWSQARTAELLAVPYFHLVFTVPGQLYPLFRANPRELFGLFFTKVAETLKTYAADPRFLGGTPGFFSVLHTTNRRLGYHPHLHVVVPGAAYNEADDKLLVVKNERFLFPVRDLAASFRARFLTGLRDLFDRGLLDLPGDKLAPLADEATREAFLEKLYQINWQLRTEAVEGHPERVIRYLSRYIFRTAISNARLLAFDGQSVTYCWKDRQTKQRRTATLPLMDFLRRFARHILPKGMQRVRFYGFLSPAKRKTTLVAAQQAAARRAELGGFALAATCTLRPEQQQAMCCESCGAEAVDVLAVTRGSFTVRISPKAYPIPPPRKPRPPRREAA